MSHQDPNKPPTVRIDPRLLLPMLGILVAPFIGFLYSADVGLLILVICLGLMAWLTWGVAEQAPPPQARTLRFGAIMNAVMSVAAMILLIYRM